MVLESVNVFLFDISSISKFWDTTKEKAAPSRAYYHGRFLVQMTQNDPKHHSNLGNLIYLIMSLVFPHEWPVFGTVSMIYRCAKNSSTHPWRPGAHANFSLNFTGPRPWGLEDAFLGLQVPLSWISKVSLGYWLSLIIYTWCQWCSLHPRILWISSPHIIHLICRMTNCQRFVIQLTSLPVNQQEKGEASPWDSCDSISLHRKGTKSSNPNLAGKTTKC